MRETVSGSYKQKGLILEKLKVLRELMRSGLGLENSKESRPLSEPLPILAPCLIRSGFKVLESEWLSTGSSTHFREWQGMGGTRIRLLLASIIVDGYTTVMDILPQVEGYFLTRKDNEHLITKKLHLSTAHLNGWLWSSHQTISQCQFQNSESL